MWRGVNYLVVDAPYNDDDDVCLQCSYCNAMTFICFSKRICKDYRKIGE